LSARRGLDATTRSQPDGLGEPVRRSLHVFSAPDGGVPEVVMRLAMGLRERGWDPWIAGPESASTYDALESSEIPIAKLPFRLGYSHPLEDAGVLRDLIGLMRRHDFDVVHMRSNKAGVLGRLAARATGVPAVYDPAGWTFQPAFHGPSGRFPSLCLERLLAPYTNAFICVSEAERRAALAHGIGAGEAFHVVHNAAPACDAVLEKDAELERFSREGPLAACIAVLRPEKDVGLFVKAAPLVFDSLPEARLAIVGNGPLREELRRHARALGLDGRLRFFDFLRPSARQLRSVDVFVLTSRYEAFGTSLAEAMACGVPQVSTAVGGATEIVRDGETGLLCRPGDPVELAGHIVKLLGDPALRARMSKASRDRHQRFFTVDRMVDETAAVFEHVIDGAPMSSAPRTTPRRKRASHDGVQVTSPAPRESWEAAVASDPNALVFHTPQWLDCICAYGGYEDASRLYELPRGRSLVLPMVRRRALGGLDSEASLPPTWDPGGIVAPGGVRVHDLIPVFSDLAGHVAVRTSLRPSSLDARAWAAARPPGVVAVPRLAHVLELESDFERVWTKRFTGTARTAVRKAERSGLTVERDTSGRLVPTVYELFERSLVRWAQQQHEPLPFARWRRRRLDPIRKFELIAQTLGEACRIWVAWHDGRPAAAILVLQGRNASYVRGMMDKELAGRTRANYLLHRLAIEEACVAGCRYYDMGESGSSPSLAQFKTRFGARARPYAAYHIERLPITALDRHARTVVKRILGFRDQPTTDGLS
jgi:glycosyltransferase involved in cell wall biosynthesis